MRVVFMGSPAFAVPSLERLLAEGHEVPLVVTQPDRAAGRRQALRPPAVKLTALGHGLAVLQPESLKEADARSAIASLAPQVIVVVAFGQFLPRSVRELPPLGCVNVHASLLPKYRGAAPIAHALLAGEAETGVSVMRVEARMDAGPVLLQKRCPVLSEDDAAALEARLAPLGADALAEGLRRLADGSAVWTPQDDAQATSAPKLTDADCRLGLLEGAVALVNRVRALAPAPGAYVLLRDGRRLRILRAAAGLEGATAGTVIRVEEEGVLIGTGKGALMLQEVQPEGKRRMSGAEFARGRRLQPGEPLVGMPNAAGGMASGAADSRPR